MKCAYPTFIVETKQGDFLVYVPDMDIYTEGQSMADAIEMARDAIGLKGIDLEDDKKNLPEASNFSWTYSIIPSSRRFRERKPASGSSGFCLRKILCLQRESGPSFRAPLA